jgi:hypothetical protein
MAGQYASGTSVSQQASINEIEKTLGRYGARGFGYVRDDDRRAAVIAFKAHGRQIRFVLPLPDPSNPEFARTTTGRERSPAETHNAYLAEVRRSWRAMALAIKAKLEVVASGIVTFEEEFASHVVLPDGSTVGEWLEPQIAEAYATGHMPELLPGAGRLAITDGT